MVRAVFFDIDGTIIDCMSQKHLAKAMLRTGKISKVIFLKIIFWFLLYKFNLIGSSSDFRRYVYKVFRQHPKQIIDDLMRNVGEQLSEQHIRSEMASIVAKHKMADELIIAMSGSIEMLCQPICKKLEIEHCFATKLETFEDKYTGEWTGDILENEHKARLVAKLAQKYDIDLSESTAYADSYSDVAMMTLFGYPVAVYPDERLRRYAQKQGWQIIGD